MVQPSVHRLSGQAAVLLLLRSVNEGQSSQEQLLLTLRASHLNIHAGEVAFPGGKWEIGDEDLYRTALREAEEEVGLQEDATAFVDELDLHWTRQGLEVQPFLARVIDERPLTANPEEIAEIFWVPTQYLMEDPRICTDVFHYKGREYWAPRYSYEGFEIWGFTARVLVEFMNRYRGCEFTRQHFAPEIFRS